MHYSKNRRKIAATITTAATTTGRVSSAAPALATQTAADQQITSLKKHCGELQEALGGARRLVITHREYGESQRHIVVGTRTELKAERARAEQHAAAAYRKGQYVGVIFASAVFLAGSFLTTYAW